MAIEELGEKWKSDLFEELVQLAIEATKEADRMLLWMPLDGEEKELRLFEIKENSVINKTQKVANTCMT